MSPLNYQCSSMEYRIIKKIRVTAALFACYVLEAQFLNIHKK